MGRRAEIRCLEIDEDVELVVVEAQTGRAAPGALTDEEAEVAVLAADGHDLSSIAEQCGTSVQEARRRLHRIMRTLGVRDTAELAVELFGE